MRNLSIKLRLSLLVGALLALIVFQSAQSLFQIREANLATQALYQDRMVPLQLLKSVSDAYAVNVVDALHKTRDGIMNSEQGLKAVNDARSVINRDWKAYTGTTLVEREKVLIERGTPLLAKADTAVQRVGELIRSADKAALADYGARELYPAIDPISETISALIQLQLDVAAEDARAHEAAARTQLWATLAVLVVVLVGAALFAWWLVRSITQPLARAVVVAETVAAGDLSSHISVDSRDETGQLMAALKRMNDSLVSVVGQVRASSDSIATGSSQIASGNYDLSQRTEEQAANLEETAASMEELTATVKHNADSSRAATQLASNACTVASQGGQMVSQVEATMTRITDASRKIADIIGTIDGIAFQTNILALNAAVEAARAGEQGRGFAVVASEVRSLAQRSAQAAKEIKALIGDNVQAVESGSGMVTEAGRTMHDIVAQVQRVSDLIGEISAASQQQSQGIGQVGEAVAQLDQVTQQNAALVEESAAAADSLQQQAARLAQVVAVFKLDAGAGASGTAMTPLTRVPPAGALEGGRRPAGPVRALAGSTSARASAPMLTQ